MSNLISEDKLGLIWLEKKNIAYTVLHSVDQTFTHILSYLGGLLKIH